MFIYKITNLINGNLYIGQTIQSNPKMRWYGHLADARSMKRKGYLQNSINKHGPENFHWEVIDRAVDLDELNLKEVQWLEHYKQTHKVYNLREAGGNKKHSLESIEKMRRVHKLRHETTKVGGWKRIDGGPMKGKVSPKKGKPSTKWSEEAKAKHSIRCIEREHRKQLLRDKET
jgi:group I intron endonuclease